MIKQKRIAAFFSKAFTRFRTLSLSLSVIDVISVVSMVKTALIYVALSANGFESSTINGFPTTTQREKKKQRCAFFCHS